MRRGFTIIESLCMLVAIFMVTWITVAVLKKNGAWPFKPEPAADSGPKQLSQPLNPEPVGDKPVAEGAK